MMAGVLLFGGVSWFLQRAPDWSPTEIDRGMLNTAARILWAVVLVATFVLFQRARSVRDSARSSTFAILAWALGEMVALFGGVVYFLTALTTWYVAGVTFLALTFVVFPGRRPG